MVGRVRPVAKVAHKAVFARVVVNIVHQRRKVVVGSDRDAPKVMLKQRACAPIGFVDGLGVSVEEIGKRGGGGPRPRP